MIRVIREITEYDRDTHNVIGRVTETYTGECAREWLREHLEVYDSRAYYDDNNNELNYSLNI